MSTIQERILESIEVKKMILSDPSILDAIQSIVTRLTEKINVGSTVFFCGNGGSSADAQHLATELSGRFYLDRKPIRAEALGTNPAFTSAIGNDYNFETIFARSLEALGRKGDVLFALSTSGKSPNILKAIKYAKSSDIEVVGLTGKDGGAFVNLCDLLVVIPSDNVPRIQEAHMLLGHIICEQIEKNLFG